MHDALPDAAPVPANPLTVLVVEDEAPVRRYLERVLSFAGYRVLAAASAAEALAHWAQEAGRVALLLTDLVLPGGLGGRQLASQLSHEKPGLKVVFASGFAASGGQTALLPGAVVVPKPFSREVLVRAVESVLGRAVAA